MSQLIRSPLERQRQSQKKIATVIQFLKQESYTNFANLMLLLRYKDKNPLYRLMRKLVAFGYVREHIFEFENMHFTIWGITDLGLTREILSEFEDFRPFEPSKVKFTTLQHKLMNQKVQIYLQRNGWTDWHNGDQYAFRRRFNVEHRPDAIITAPGNHVIAIETERSLKTAHRYRSIFKSHILAQKKGYWKAVFYVVENDDIKKLLSRRFDQVKFIPFDESKHPFELYRDKLVRIKTLDELKQVTS
ncbi:MobC family replication-relaxation protein [Vibrio sagamiensis]|uniref:Molybdopterin-guanine dinucleotide biosynthesis protein MobC n=1 Tax=Vibrio sagamiensis NBRC 104589 TaxID=1219064 RepID=A0A511QJM8_9VIBR|nr:MobC family replication-relaxation protein [Vibrio sagamiensis]PNQ71065.1 mobilization protein [Vibrio agarivorans]PNQ71090.1 mobilization protein [Vibrio agarivorans]GEM77499.1 molybdopterin-guanine dinucleotide biosynthesis protein MobC [Vibrio sagamiensis NBRC 104589]